jgi:hypothetical protein
MPKRNAISVDTMLAINDRLNSWEKQADLAREYDLAKNTIVTFKKIKPAYTGLCSHS